MENTSKKFTINGVDIWKVIRGTFITILAVAGVAVIDHISSVFQTLNYNVCIDTMCIDFKFLAVPIIGGLLELGRRFFTNYRKNW